MPWTSSNRRARLPADWPSRVRAATIRTWADRGKIKPVDVDDRGRRRYDPAEVAAYAAGLAVTKRATRPA